MNTVTLELIFQTASGKTVRITLRDPIQPVNPAEVNAVMDTVIAQNIFRANNDPWVAKVGARLQDRTVTEIALG